MTALAGSMADVGQPGPLAGPFDLIWCAGAIYFLGVTEGLRLWRPALAPGGHVAFSEPVWLTDTPDEGARAFWEEYAAITGTDGLRARISAADYEVKGIHPLPASAWEAYYGPMEARIASLRPGASPALTRALDDSAREAALWRAHGAAFTYALCVVAPA